MPRKADQFRQSDVTLWGTVALVAFGLAIVGANVSAAIPDAVFAGLHATRFVDRSAADLRAQLAAVSDARAEIASLTATEQQLQAANGGLAARFDGLVEEAGGVRQRVAALEDSIPRLIKTLPAVRGVDPTVITGSIGAQPVPEAASAAPSTAAAWRAGDVSTQTSRSAAAPTSTLASADAGISGSAADEADSQPMPAPLVPLAGTPAGNRGAMASADPHVAPVDPSAATTGAAPAMSSVAVPLVATAVSSATAGTPATDAMMTASLRRHAGPVPLAPFRTVSPSVQPDAVPQPGANAQPDAIASTVPAPVATPDVRAIGVAIGPPVTPGAALAAWEGLAAKVGVMLVGMSPLLADDPSGSGGKVLVAGPITSIPIATTLCADIDRAGLACTPMPYVGTELGAAGPAAPTP